MNLYQVLGKKEKGDSFSCDVDCSECFGQYLCGMN